VPPVVTVVLDSCAKAVPSASAQRAPAANIFVILFCFMFVLCLVERMFSVVVLSDSSQPLFIHPQFVRRQMRGRIVP
jgi:hypothetical protein